MSRSEQASRKEHLVEVADALFDRHGYHQTGVDLIMRSSGVSKTTLYKYFPTKEDLIVEVLQRRSARVRQAMLNALDDTLESDPDAIADQRLAAMLAVVFAWIEGGSFFGCNFVRAASEYQAPGHPVREQARVHKEATCSLIAQAVGPERAAEVALILEGAMATALVSDPQAAAMRARRLVERLMQAPVG